MLKQSIQYAADIQSVIIADDKLMQNFFSDFFSIYLPKDLVSGDFYWYSQIDESQALMVVADCTGHGVPGAFMSVLGCTILHETVNIKGIGNDPSQILKDLNSAIITLLRQDEGRNSDGMDLSICYFNTSSPRELKITYAGAKSNMFYYTQNELFEVKGDRIYIGGSDDKDSFKNQEFSLNYDTNFYFLSDGYQDQNNANRERIGKRKLKELFNEVQDYHSFEQQKEHLIKFLEEHQGNEKQRDDITILGLSLRT